MSPVQERWVEGATYERFMGRWSRVLASEFVTWLQIPERAHWLDVGCGTGAMSRAICALANPASTLGCDLARPFVEYARAHSTDSRATFLTSGIGSLPGRTGGYGSITSLLALNFFPDPFAAIREMRTLAASGGTISACVWDYSEGMEFLRYFWDAVAEVDPASKSLHEGGRFPLCRPAALMDLFQRNNLQGVRCEPMEIQTEFPGFDDYWAPFLGGTGPAPAYVASLDARRLSSLARRLQDTLPAREDGRIALRARAWAVRGNIA